MAFGMTSFALSVAKIEAELFITRPGQKLSKIYKMSLSVTMTDWLNIN